MHDGEYWVQDAINDIFYRTCRIDTLMNVKTS